MSGQIRFPYPCGCPVLQQGVTLWQEHNEACQEKRDTRRGNQMLAEHRKVALEELHAKAQQQELRKIQ